MSAANIFNLQHNHSFWRLKSPNATRVLRIAVGLATLFTLRARKPKTGGGAFGGRVSLVPAPNMTQTPAVDRAALESAGAPQ